MDTYISKEEALKVFNMGGGFALLWNRAESDRGKTFYLAKTPETVMDVFRRSLERGVTNHYHEVVDDISKIYFDLDLKIPESLIYNTEVK